MLLEAQAAENGNGANNKMLEAFLLHVEEERKARVEEQKTRETLLNIVLASITRRDDGSGESR